MGGREEAPLTVQSGMKAICVALQRPGSGLEVRDRLWLKITIPQAFIGSDVVNWLYARVAGFADRREARKYATLTSSSPSLASTVQAAGQGREEAPLTVQSGMKAICVALQQPGSGLEVRDRLW